ncbi:response regulator transcription factor [Haloarchaeobius sp. DFWS5]|uniref:response regulator transcription factor n=1 Tax=Haloarchaeobius sp. DFWS5 TaxID=3446114 RepID=UPI003EBBF68D
MCSETRPADRALATDGGTDVPSSAAGSEDTVILVVDDDEDLAVTISLWLQEEYTVEMAHNGEEALDAYGPHIDVVLLDRRMPTMSGDETLTRLRERGATVPVAMMTAVDPELDIADLPLDMYLRKPVRRDPVVEAVASLVDRNCYDEPTRQAFAIGSKFEILGENYSEEELAADSRTRGLADEFVRLQDETAIVVESDETSTELATTRTVAETIREH